MVKRAPDGASSRSCTSISPSWPFTIAWAMARPRPEWRPKLSPSGRTEWKRLKIASRASVGNSRALVVDPDSNFVPDPRHCDFDKAAGRREADCIVDDRVDRPGEPVGLAHDDRAILARTSKSEPRVAGFAASFPAMRPAARSAGPDRPVRTSLGQARHRFAQLR